MNKIRIDYERDKDRLTIGFHGENLGVFDLHNTDHFIYGAMTITDDGEKIITMSFIINDFMRSRAAALKKISEYKVSLIDNLDPLIETVMKADIGSERVVFDFCQLRNGSWGEVDQSDNFN